VNAHLNKHFFLSRLSSNQKIDTKEDQHDGIFAQNYEDSEVDKVSPRDQRDTTISPNGMTQPSRTHIGYKQSQLK